MLEGADAFELKPGRGGDVRADGFGQKAAVESEFRCLTYASLDLPNRSYLACQADLADEDRLGVDRSIKKARADRRNHGQVGGRLVDPDPARNVHEYVLTN